MPTDNETPVEPYVERKPQDLIRSRDWNDLQVMARRHIRTHTHTGGEQGMPVPREGIALNAIDGPRIDPESRVQVTSLSVSEALNVGSKDLIQEIARLDAAKVNRAGDTITGGLTVGGPLSVKAAIRAPVLGIGSGQQSLPAKLSLGMEGANTKLALHDDPNDLYGLGIQAWQFRLHVGSAKARFSFLNGADGAEVLTIQGAGQVGINFAKPQEALVLGGKGSTIELGAGVEIKEGNAGKIGYQRFSDGLDIVGAGATWDKRSVTMWAEGGTTFYGGLQVHGAAITPEVGNVRNAGIQFPTDPGGGSGDEAFIRYFVTGEEGDPEATKLLIGIENDANDVLAFQQAGAERMVLRSGELHLLTSTVRGTGSLHIITPERLYLLPKKEGVWITKDEGACGDLRVAGRLGVGTLSPQAQFEVAGGYTTTNIAPMGLAINTGGASPDRAQIVWGDNTGWKLHFGTHSHDEQANFLPRVTFVDVGWVGINHTAPEETLALGGKGSTIELGAGVEKKEASAGKIGYQRFSDGLDIVGAGATVAERKVTIHAQGGTTFHGGLRAYGGAITPEVGNASGAGIQFPTDPGGGTGNAAFIRYFATVEGGTPGESGTKLLIGIDKDPNDVLALWQGGSERLTFRNEELQLGTTMLRATDELNIISPKRLYLLPAEGVWLTKEGEASGDLHVGGTLMTRQVSVVGDLEVYGAINPSGGNGPGVGIMFPTNPDAGRPYGAYIRYIVSGESGNPDETMLLIGCDSGDNDVLAFRQAGAERMVFRNKEVQLVGADTIRCTGRMHITGTERLYLLPKDGVFITKNWEASGTLFVEGTKSFRIDHPLDPQNKDLIHACIEGPEAAVFYRGEARLTDGIAELELPPYFEALTRKEDRTVLLTPKLEGREPVSALAASAVVEGRFTVKAIDRNNASQAFYWEVKAVRADVERLVVEDARLPRPE